MGGWGDVGGMSYLTDWLDRLKLQGEPRDIRQAVLDRLPGAEERKWMDNANVQRVMRMGQRKDSKTLHAMWQKTYNKKPIFDGNL